ncbi:UNVERIFIED_CONTAM: hypothetical protein GTU68_057000 [Idotea baltica]|nr:hypothetical protein [Idotea baltica]
MKEILSSVFTVETACNGRHGLEVARSSIPNLIITDVMMPELDGFRFTNKVRESPETSHIPIIMLTAKADHLDRIQGLQTGVDDYLTKPFDISELLVRSQNLINQRKHLLKRFSSKSLFQPSEIASTPVDDVFLTKVMQTIESEFANPDFGVEDLSRSVAFSRSQLHRKLKALTDKSPNELIRIFRLERAKMLLQDKAGNASEIAYQVGFNSLPYFSKCYKDQFGISPSEV